MLTCGENERANKPRSELAERLSHVAEAWGLGKCGRYEKTLEALGAKFIPDCASVKRFDWFMVDEDSRRLSLSEKRVWDRFVLAQDGCESDEEIAAFDAVFAAMVNTGKSCEELLNG